MFSITPLIRPNSFNELKTHCGLGLWYTASCVTWDLSLGLRTRESLTPVPFYCIFLLTLRLNAEFVLISFYKIPLYVSSLWLRRTQVLVSHAGSRLGKRKPSSSPTWDSSSGLHQIVVLVIILLWVLISKLYLTVTLPSWLPH